MQREYQEKQEVKQSREQEGDSLIAENRILSVEVVNKVNRDDTITKEQIHQLIYDMRDALIRMTETTTTLKRKQKKQADIKTRGLLPEDDVATICEKLDITELYFKGGSDNMAYKWMIVMDSTKPNFLKNKDLIKFYLGKKNKDHRNYWVKVPQTSAELEQWKEQADRQRTSSDFSRQTAGSSSKTNFNYSANFRGQRTSSGKRIEREQQELRDRSPPPKFDDHGYFNQTPKRSHRSTQVNKHNIMFRVMVLIMYFVSVNATKMNQA